MIDIIPIGDFPNSISEPWWIVAGIIEAATADYLLDFQLIDRRLEPNGMQATVTRAGTVRGRFILTGDDTKSELVINALDESDPDAFWNMLLDLLGRTANAAAVHRRRSWATTAEGAIEHYYRSRARGSRVSLKDIAELTGFSYSYITKTKMEYDRAGKWGSPKALKETVKTSN